MFVETKLEVDLVLVVEVKHAQWRDSEKLESDVDYATFMQREKSWKLHVVSDQFYILSDEQKSNYFQPFQLYIVEWFGI